MTAANANVTLTDSDPAVDTKLQEPVAETKDGREVGQEFSFLTGLEGKNLLENH